MTAKYEKYGFYRSQPEKQPGKSKATFNQTANLTKTSPITN
jgi:hypothetical protein